jgi:hypothetical protein
MPCSCQTDYVLRFGYISWSLNMIHQRYSSTYQKVCRRYSRVTSTKSPSFCTTTFSASRTYLTALLPQSHDWSWYVSRPILAPPLFWLQRHADLRAHDFAHSPGFWHQSRLANVTSVWNRRLVELIKLYRKTWEKMAKCTEGGWQ